MGTIHGQPERHSHKFPTNLFHRQSTGTQAHASYELLSWEEHMDNQRGTQTFNTALNTKLHTFYNYKINIFAG